MFESIKIKQISSLLLLLAFLFPAQVAQAKKPEKISSFLKMEVIKYQLPNGLTVVLNPDKNFSLFSYELRIAVGGRHERPGHTGISHMFEHLMFEGTKKYPGSAITYLEANGAVRVNATTSADRTNYFSSLPPEKLEFVMELEADRMMNLIINKDRLEAERGAVKEEKKLNYGNKPIRQMFLAFIDALYTKHPYRQPVIGYDEDIANYTLKDLENWYRTYYSPNNTVLVLSGNFNASKAKKYIEKYFGPWEKQKIKPEQVIKEPVQKVAKNVRLKKNIQSMSASMGFKVGPSGTKDNLAIQVIASVLGSGQSSRLYKSIVRQNKLATSASAYNYSLLQEDVFAIFFTPINKTSEAKAKKIILQEIEKIKNELISKEEFEKIKNQTMLSLIKLLKSTNYRTRILAEYETNFGDYQKFYRELDELESLTPEFIQQVAKKYLSPNKMTYIVMEPK